MNFFKCNIVALEDIVKTGLFNCLNFESDAPLSEYSNLICTSDDEFVFAFLAGGGEPNYVY